MKKHLKVVGTGMLAFSLLVTPVYANESPTPNNPSVQAFDNKIVKRIDVSKIYDHISHLSEDIGPRVAGTEGEWAAVQYIADQYRQLGLEVEIQEFEFQRGSTMITSHNVIATKKAKKNHDTGQIIYLGSHHDSVPGSPGASDNASGVGVNLELARVLSNMPTDTEIRFLTFGGEEFGLKGSRHYVSTLTEDELNRSVGMFNFDMVGSSNAGEMIMFTVDGERNTVTNLAASSSIRVFEPLTYGRVGRSDHQPFHDVGIASAAFSYAPLEPEFHQPTDTIEKLSIEKLENMANVVGSAIYQIARKETPALENARVAPQPVEPPFENRPL